MSAMEKSKNPDPEMNTLPGVVRLRIERHLIAQDYAAVKVGTYVPQEFTEAGLIKYFELTTPHEYCGYKMHFVDLRKPGDCFYASDSGSRSDIRNWHSDCGSDPDSKSHAVIFWASMLPTEIRGHDGTEYRFEPYDIVLMNNLACLHRAHRDAYNRGHKRWAYINRIFPVTSNRFR